jgi:hypothetical protein
MPAVHSPLLFHILKAIGIKSENIHQVTNGDGDD